MSPHFYEHQEALLTTISLGEVVIMRKCLDAGFGLNIIGEDGRGLLLLAAYPVHNSQKRVKNTVSFLLDHGADINFRDSKSGMTPLLTLCSVRTPGKETADAAITLLWEGTNILITCDSNEFPLVKAAQQI